ncbi:MAG: pantoate--beta-alanine ligase, partial [Deltaproteobacteria bacterium]
RPDYVELRDPTTLEPVLVARPESRLILAAFVGTTRLLDNAPVGG